MQKKMIITKKQLKNLINAILESKNISKVEHLMRPDDFMKAKLQASRWLSDQLAHVWNSMTQRPDFHEIVLDPLKRGEFDSGKRMDRNLESRLMRMWRSIRLDDAVADDGQPRIWEFVFDPVTIPELDDYLAVAAEEDGRELEDIEFRLTFHLWTEKKHDKLAMIVPQEYDLHIFLHNALRLGDSGLRELVSDANHELHHLARSEAGRHAGQSPCGEVAEKMNSLSEAELKRLFPEDIVTAIDYMSKKVEISSHAMEAAMWLASNAPELEATSDVESLRRGIDAVAERDEPSSIYWALEFLEWAKPDRKRNKLSEISTEGEQKLAEMGITQENLTDCLSKLAHAYADMLSYYLRIVRRNLKN